MALESFVVMTPFCREEGLIALTNSEQDKVFILRRAEVARSRAVALDTLLNSGAWMATALEEIDGVLFESYIKIN